MFWQNNLGEGAVPPNRFLRCWYLFSTQGSRRIAFTRLCCRFEVANLFVGGGKGPAAKPADGNPKFRTCVWLRQVRFFLALQEWMGYIIVPMLRDSLASVSNFVYIGITGDVPAFGVPFSGEIAEDSGSDELLLLTHLRQAIGHAKELFRFGLIPSMWPWRWVHLLSPSRRIRESCVEAAREVRGAE